MILELSKLVTPPSTDAIFGRKNGSTYAIKKNLLIELEKGTTFIIKIDSSIVKSINDSFIKGMFSDIFKTYKSFEFVKNNFEFNADKHFQDLFCKNWIILEAIYKNS